MPASLLLILPALVAPPTPAPANLEALAWLQGRWQAQKGPQVVEEQWSLQGASLLGVSWTLAAGQSRSFEMLLLEKQGDDWVLRLRMFGPALDKATRGKEEPLRLKLVAADATHFRCEGLGPEEGTTLIYERTGPDKMQARIAKTRDGRVLWSESFDFKKVQ